ncbi:MAG: 4'-phosphopantetheinyl transferase superfamily protein [Lachnospiraceae bacterium]|nr:4'-phosphopantetheinyl transferase superfamily protein [Lachnospiraceae bacterium]
MKNEKLSHKTDRNAFVYYVRLENRKDMEPGELTACGRRLLRQVLHAKYGIKDEPLRIEKMEHGKPYLADYPKIQYNLSHSGDYLVLGLAAMPIGIDIQEKRVTDIDKLGKRIFSVDEYRQFLLSENRQEAFFREWVLKESYVKWTGKGLFREDIRELPMDGWSQFLYIDNQYFCAIRAELPLDVHVEEIRLENE